MLKGGFLADERPSFVMRCVSGSYVAELKGHTKVYAARLASMGANIITASQQNDDLSWILRHIEVTLSRKS